MKKHSTVNKIFIFVFFAMILVACDKDEGKEGGKETMEDIIGLSQKVVSFQSEAGKSEVTTKGNKWRIHAFVNDETYEFIQEILCDSDVDSVVYTYDWVSIQKIDTKKVEISVDENSSEESRCISIQFVAGGYADYISVKQEGVNSSFNNRKDG